MSGPVTGTSASEMMTDTYIEDFYKMYDTLVDSGVDPVKKAFIMPLETARQLFFEIQDLKKAKAQAYQHGRNDAADEMVKWLDAQIKVVDEDGTMS